MQQEIEAKFLDVDHDDVREKLRAARANLEQPMRLMRRDLFDYPDGRLRADNHGRVRVRDEGDRITVSYKRGGEGEYSTEVETTIGSYDEMCKIFEAIGLTHFTQQESKRETWQLNDVEVVLDEWPWLNPYIEIEGPSEVLIKQAAIQLGFDWADAKFGNVDTAYRAQYPGITKQDSISRIGELRFEGEMPAWLKERM